MICLRKHLEKRRDVLNSMGLSTIAEHSLQINACRVSRERGLKTEVESNSWLLGQFDCGATFCTCYPALALAERRGNVFSLPEGYVQEVASI